MYRSKEKVILIFVDWFEPGFKAGGPIQSCKNFSKAMQDQFTIKIITSDRDSGDTTPYPSVRINSWNNYDSNVEVYYLSPDRMTLSNIGDLIEQVSPDFIYLNSMYSLKFTIFPLLILKRKKFSIPVILSPRGMLQKGAMQFKSVKKNFFIRLLKLVGIPKHILFHATDLQEQKDIQNYFPKAKGYFIAENFPSTNKTDWTMVPKETGSVKLIFLSRIVPKKNLMYLLRLFLDHKVDFQTSLHIAGDIEDAGYWKECEGLIKQLPHQVEVQYIGAIPNAEIFERYKSYHVFVLPTLGENFGHAIYEALLCGKPVVLSDQTPWKSLEAKKVGYDVPLDEPSAFFQAIKHFAEMDQEEYNEWSIHAKEFVLQQTNVTAIKEKYLQAFA